MDELQVALQRDMEKDSHLREITLHIHKNGTDEAIVTIEGVVKSFYQKQLAQESTKRACVRREVQFTLVNNVYVTRDF